ncbi:Hypothetical Protein sle_03780 [Streptomyces leeuwenhoekii]|uniref:Uncharacterized protein n=1 Tax=Streptomyces leeuwenhoekii TaxID=1437453 RepID=A0A0F7VLR2_STRLW|nr:Hypothetical Protein sle_03780 [Streptomyces leeuwenhoekii]
MAGPGVHADVAPVDSLAAMDGCKDRDPDLTIVRQPRVGVLGGTHRCGPWDPRGDVRARTRCSVGRVHEPTSSSSRAKTSASNAREASLYAFTIITTAVLLFRSKAAQVLKP